MTDINQAVEYRYLAQQQQQHRWRVKLLGGCSRSCGGGHQATVLVYTWVTGSWGRCGDTCAQTRELTCRQQLAGGVSIPVSRELCPAPSPASAHTCEQSASRRGPPLPPRSMTEAACPEHSGYWLVGVSVSTTVIL